MNRLAIALVATMCCGLQAFPQDGKANLLIDTLFFSEKPIEMDRRAYSMSILRNDKGETMIFVPSMELSEDSRRYAMLKSEVQGADEWLALAHKSDKLFTMGTGNTPLAIKEGDRIGRFSVTDWNGRVWTDRNTLGKPLVLNFWYTGCGPCIREMPELSTWPDICPEANYLAITWESAADARKIVESRHFRFVQVTDEMGLFRKFNVGPMPLTVVVDKNGIIRKIVEGSSRQKRDILLECIRQLTEAPK